MVQQVYCKKNFLCVQIHCDTFFSQHDVVYLQKIIPLLSYLLNSYTNISRYRNQQYNKVRHFEIKKNKKLTTVFTRYNICANIKLKCLYCRILNFVPYNFQTCNIYLVFIKHPYMLGDKGSPQSLQGFLFCFISVSMLMQKPAYVRVYYIN